MKITLLLLVVGVCLVSAKYLPYDTEESNGLLIRNKRSDSDESNSSRVKESHDSDEDDDDSLEKKIREREEKRREKEEKLRKKLEEQQEKEKRKEEEHRRKEEERHQKLEEKRIKEERKEHERIEKEERKRKEKLEKEKQKLEEHQRKEDEKRVKEEKKRQDKVLHDLRKEAYESQSQDDSFLETEEENSVEMEDIWRSHIYMKYGLTLASTNLEKQTALEKYIQEELGLQPNSTKSERRQAIINLIQTKLQNDTVAIDAIRKQVLSRLNPVTLQNLRTDIDKDLEEINNKTNLLKNITLPWATSAQQNLEQKRSFLQTISQFMANIIPNWFSGNQPQINVPVNNEATVVNIDPNTDGSANIATPSDNNQASISSNGNANSQTSPNEIIIPGLENTDTPKPNAVNDDQPQSLLGVSNGPNDVSSVGTVPIKPIPSNFGAGGTGTIYGNTIVSTSGNAVPNSPQPDVPLVENNGATSSINSGLEAGNNEAMENRPVNESEGSIGAESVDNAGISSTGNVNPPNSGPVQPIGNESGTSTVNDNNIIEYVPAIDNSINVSNNDGSNILTSNIPDSVSPDGNNVIIPNDINANNEVTSLDSDRPLSGSDSIGNALPPLIENAGAVSQSTLNNDEIVSGANDKVSTEMPSFENNENLANIPTNSVVDPIANPNGIQSPNNEPSVIGTDSVYTTSDNNAPQNNVVSSSIVTSSPENLVPEPVNNVEGSGQIPETGVTSDTSVNTNSGNVIEPDSANTSTIEIPKESEVIDSGVGSLDSSHSVASDSVPSGVDTIVEPPINTETSMTGATEPILNKNESVSVISVPSNADLGPNSVSFVEPDLTGSINKEPLSLTNVLDNSSSITTEIDNVVADSAPAGSAQGNLDTAQAGQGQNTLGEENTTGVSNTEIDSSTNNVDITGVTEQSETVVTETLAPSNVENTVEAQAVTDSGVNDATTLDAQSEQSATGQDYTTLLELGTTESVANTPIDILEDFTPVNEPGATVVEIVTQ